MRFIVILFYSLTLCITTTNAQVPAKVKAAFTKKFPKAQDVDWEELEKENIIQYEASFIESKKEKTSVFLSDGTWIETVIYLDNETEVPAKVKSTLKEELEGELSFDQLMWVEKQEVAYYEITVTDENDTEWTARITKEGKLLALE